MPIMLYFLIFILAFACSAQGVIVERKLDDGYIPSGTTNPSTVKDCKYWVNFQSGDTCFKYTEIYGITAKDLIKLNPSLNSDCSGLTSGYSYCIDNPDLSVETSTSVSKTKLPSPTSTKVSPTQTGLISTCQRFYKVNTGDSCEIIVNIYGTFSLSNFYSWNPAVGTRCQRLLAGYYVCVGVSSTPTTQRATITRTTKIPTITKVSGPSPTQRGLRSDCTRFYKALAGDNCNVIAGKFRTFTVSQFQSWNPAVGSTCSALLKDYFYCIAIPGTPTTPIAGSANPVNNGPQPQQPGTVSYCKKFYQVEPGDSCSGIEQRFGISAADFNVWNPRVGSDCQTLFAGFFICTGV